MINESYSEIVDFTEDDIRIKRFNFLSSNKYTEIHGIMWIPRGEILAIVQISHGMAEHIERYDEFARYLVRRGILVVGNNHMGHGDSINSKEDLGYFSIPIKGLGKRALTNNDSSANAVKDLYHITKITKKHYPGIPYILLGHSMGSFLARRYIMRYGNAIDGAILIGTGNQKNSTINTGLLLTKLITAIYGERHRSKVLNKMMFGTYNRKIKKPKSENDWICSHKETIKKYNEDELCGFLFTMNGIEALLSTLKYITKQENIDKIPNDIRMLILSGMDDPVGNYGEDVTYVYEKYKSHGVEDIEMKLYKDCRHEILNETIRAKVYRDIFDWIEERFL